MDSHSSALALPGAITETSLDLSSGLTFEEWERVGDVLGRIGRAHQWWVGDWLNYGEREYGEKYAQAMDVTGLDYSAVANYAWVAKAFEPSTRVEGLTWTHHREVASLDPVERESHLSAAKVMDWSVADLRMALRSRETGSSPPLPDGRYRTILADPPWHYDDHATMPGDPAKRGHEVKRDPLPYPTMSMEEITALPVGDLAAPDCRLFLWTTNRYLPAAFDVLRAWAFDYSECIVWHKTGNPSPFGRGVVPRDAEFLLVAKRGAPELLTCGESAVVCAQKPYRHSRKPAGFRDLIEAASPGPYLQLFCTEDWGGNWAGWGNEIAVKA